MKQYFFCSAKIRPEKCFKAKSNLCCVYCELHSECIKEHLGLKIKPCPKDAFTDEEPCDFNI